jgi:hypothetical protein
VVWEILPSRQVMACDLVARIFGSRGIPVGSRGMACDAATAMSVAKKLDNSLADKDDSGEAPHAFGARSGVVAFG